ncbi:MAG: hypothetical protein ACI9FJ_000843 [Alteromonadaceae bacterium]|jgi:hypothetical protein
MDRLLFQIRLSHDYYPDKVMSRLTLVADTTTQAFLNRYRLISNTRQGMFCVHYYGQGDRLAFVRNLHQLLDEAPLRFTLKSQNSDFYVISDLPIDWLGDLAFDTNYVESSVESSGNAQAEQVLGMTLQPRQLVGSDDVGTLCVWPQNLCDTQGDITHQHFAINIRSRQTHWHYTIFNRSGVKLNSPVVTDQQGIEFENAGPVTAENGQQALLFRSGDHVFAMAQKQEYSFSLLNRVEPKNITLSPTQAVTQQLVLSDLPVPPTDKVNREIRDGQQRVYSQMYVYL